MSSGIPTFGSKKLPTNQSRLAVPSTLHKSSLIPNVRAPLSSAKRTHLSGIKRPSENAILSQTKFKRTTPLSLIRSNVKTTVSNQAGTRLDFSDFKTHILNRNAPFHMAPDNKEDGQNAKLKNILTESKATSPIIDWNVYTKNAEISSLKSKISLLEKQIDEMNLKRSQVRIASQVEETKIKSELDSNLKTIMQLKEEMDLFKENEIKLKNEYEKLKSDSLEQTDIFEKRQIEYEKTIADLRNELSQSASNESNTRFSLTSKNVQLSSRINELENELERSRSEILIYSRNFEELKLKETDNQCLKSDLMIANTEINRLTDDLSKYIEGAQLKNILKSELKLNQQIQEENSHLKNQLDQLKDAHEQNFIYKEQLLSYETENEELKKIITQKNIDIGELNYSKRRINEWIQIVGIDSPDIVVKNIDDLKQTIQLLQLENDQLKAEIKSKDTTELFRDSSSKSLENDLKDALKKIDLLNDALKKTNRKCLLYSKEKESYKRVINSYESEITINFDDVSRKRIIDLENSILGYEELQKNQEQELEVLKHQVVNLVEKDKEIFELKAEIERIKTLNPYIYTNMSLNVSTLQTNEKNFRVMHLKKNPLTIKINEYANEHSKLREENIRLKTLVELYESGNFADMTRLTNEGIAHRHEFEKLQNKLTVKEAKYNNLKSHFQKISNSFREACLYLTGYKIDNIANEIFKLTHAYDSSKRALIFEIKNQQISMLQENSLESFQDKIDTYLTGGDSYPAFLAAFTLELYQNRNNLSKSSFVS